MPWASLFKVLQKFMSLPHPSSLWNVTAPDAPQLPRLASSIKVDCAVIGGGFTGLNAAWHLMKNGVQTCVLEANDAGWGASGRNGGMAVLRYKHGWAALSRKFGPEATLLLHRLVHEAVDTLESNVRELGLDGGFSRCGHITAAHSKADAEALQQDLSWLAKHADDSGPRFLSASEMQERVGTSAYCGGYLDMKAAGVNPLAYARELASALTSKGLPLYVDSPALRIDTGDNHCIIHTPGGTVEAKTVIVATNAYTDAQPLANALQRAIIPVNTSVVATGAVPEHIWNQILPQGQLVTDTRHLVNYFRRVPGNRILFGGRGSLTGTEHSSIYEGLAKLLYGTFPVLKDVPIDFHWSGRVAVTLDDFPHVGQYSPRVFFAMGYGGRGVALTHLLGKLAAEMAMGTAINAGPMGHPLRPIPLHGYRLPMMNLVAAYYRLRDLLKI